MATIADLLARKGATVHTIEPSATVLQATQEMNRQQIGALVVRDGPHVVGIFTERDVLRRVVAEQRDPRTTRLADVMTAHVACAARDTTLEEVASVMKNRRIRHLPVLSDDGGLLGLVSLGDINAWTADGQEQTIRFLHDYIHGRV